MPCGTTKFSNVVFKQKNRETITDLREEFQFGSSYLVDYEEKLSEDDEMQFSITIL